MSEVKRYGTFTLITEYMENLKNMREDEETLMEELREKSKLIDYIRCAHVKEKQLSSSVVTAYNNSIRETLRVYEEATGKDRRSADSVAVEGPNFQSTL